MGATPDRYLTPYVSQMLSEPDRTYDDCAAATGLMLGGDWTLGEILLRPDGKQRDLPTLRNVVRKRIGDTDGGLTLHDVNDILHELDPDIADLWRYPGQKAKPGQSTDGATLRITWDQFKDHLQKGWSAALCGRTASGVGHVVHVTDGDKDGATLRDPLTRNGVNWRGVRTTWAKLREFTERGPDRYGSPTMIACALVKVGDETEADRVRRKALVTAAKLNDRLAAQKAQTTLATEERDQARREVKTALDAYQATKAELATALADLAACESATPPDCSTAVADATKAEHARMVALMDAFFESVR